MTLMLDVPTMVLPLELVDELDWTEGYGVARLSPEHDPFVLAFSFRSEDGSLLTYALDGMAVALIARELQTSDDGVVLLRDLKAGTEVKVQRSGPPVGLEEAGEVLDS